VTTMIGVMPVHNMIDYKIIMLNWLNLIIYLIMLMRVKINYKSKFIKFN